MVLGGKKKQDSTRVFKISRGRGFMKFVYIGKEQQGVMLKYAGDAGNAGDVGDDCTQSSVTCVFPVE